MAHQTSLLNSGFRGPRYDFKLFLAPFQLLLLFTRGQFSPGIKGIESEQVN